MFDVRGETFSTHLSNEFVGFDAWRRPRLRLHLIVLHRFRRSPTETDVFAVKVAYADGRLHIIKMPVVLSRMPPGPLGARLLGGMTHSVKPIDVVRCLIVKRDVSFLKVLPSIGKNRI